MTELYENKSSKKIKELLTDSFNKIEKENWLWTRDDKEIALAWMKVCDYIYNSIKRDPTKASHSPWAMERIVKYRAKLEEDYKNLNWWKPFIDKEKIIHEVANKIDNAENETLQRLKRIKTIEESRKIVEKSKKIHNGTNMLVMEWWNDISKQTWAMIFTAATNKIPIHEALKWLFDDNPNIVYKIDYSNCKTNDSEWRWKAIKEKMTWLIWSKTCYLKYDKDQKTYTIRDKNGNWIDNRALIREWVKIIPDWVRQRWAYNEHKKIKEKMWNIEESQASKFEKELLRDMPSAKELTPDQRNKLISKTENRLSELLKWAKDNDYELQTECISKKWGSWLMELHLISEDAKKDITIWEDDKILWSDIYNFIDWTMWFIGSKEWEYKTYLTNRVKSKRQELEWETKVDITNVWKKWRENLTDKEKEKELIKKQWVLRGIWLLERMVNEYRISEWNSMMSNNDNSLVDCLKILRNCKASIEKINYISDDAIINKYILPFLDKWAPIKNVPQVKDSPIYRRHINKLKTIFFWNEGEQEYATRKLWWHWRVFDNTETSWLKWEIESRDFGHWWLKVEKQEINKCIDRMETWFSRPIYNKDWSINENVKKDYDRVLNMANDGFKSNVIDFFVNNDMLPKNWKDEKDEVLDFVERLQEQLTIINDQINNFPEDINSLKKKQHIKKLQLEQKEHKTENDIIEIQALTYLEENEGKQTEILTKVLEEMKEDIKYWNLAQTTKACLMPVLAFLGWWTNNEIYNDIIWYWIRNLSDENAKLAWEIAVEIAITVVVAAITAWVWELVVGWALWAAEAWSATMAWVIGVDAAADVTWLAMRSGRWLNLAKNVSKLVRLNNLWIEWFKVANTTWKIAMLTTKATWLLIEGTAFNAASELIHSAMHWTSLDNLKLNPFARENIQTGAFLWMLSITWKITQSMMRIWWKSKLSINLKEWLEIAHKQSPMEFTAWLVAEMWSMLAAEQAINIIFWHDVVNPETGEIETSRIPQEPTKEELIQMVWMILAFRAVKLKLWENYIKRMNEWTLEICRSVKKNEILLRDIKTWETEKIQDLIDWKPPKLENKPKPNENENVKKKNTTKKAPTKKATPKTEVKTNKENKTNKDVKTTEIRTKIEEIDKQIDEIKNNKEIANHETLANDISKRRTYSDNGNRPSENIPINEHYEWRIIDGKIQIIDKRTKEITEVDFDAKGKIKNLIDSWKIGELEKLDIEIAQRMILSIKNWHIEVWESKAEAEKIVNWYPEENLEVIKLENGNYGVCRKNNELENLNQRKADLEGQLKDLWNESREPNKKNKTKAKTKTKTKEQEQEKPKEQEQEKPKEQEQEKGRKQEEEQQQKEQEKIKEQQTEKNKINDNDSPEVIAEKLEKAMENDADFDISQEAFESWRFLEWVKNRINKIIKISNYSLQKSSIKRLYNKITEMMKKCKNLSKKIKNTYERVKRYLENIEKQPWEVVKMNKHTNTERPDRWINTERREMREVQRNSDVIAIGDLHWEFWALVWNLEFAWLAREINWHLEWTGWNKKVVFQWDILADRGTDWLRIIQEIHQLREQARQQWWDIDIIVWNHEDFLISYLTETTWNRFHDLKGWAIEISILWDNQWLWLTELGKFIWKNIWDFNGLKWNSILDIIRKTPRQKIIKAMRNSPEWRMILEEICNMKIVSQVDDVLYCHTNPTPEMLSILTNWNIQNNINTINQKYQWYLRKVLLWKWKNTISTKEFNQISDIFLDTANRNNQMSWIENYMNTLKNNGINMISHGHNWGKWYRYTEIWWIKIVDTDHWYWKLGEYWDGHSVSVVKKEWWINYIWDDVANQNNTNNHARQQRNNRWNQIISQQRVIETNNEVDKYYWYENIYSLVNYKWKKATIIDYDPTTLEYTINYNKWILSVNKKVTREMFTFIQDYKIWDEVYVKRTNWWESRAIITWYDPIKNAYKVTFNDWQIIKEKYNINPKEMRNTKSQRYEEWDEVYIKMRDWKEIKAKMISCDNEAKKYTAVYEYWWKTHTSSNITPDIVRHANKPEYEIWSEVYVQRSNWWMTRGRITEYNPENNTYRVDWRDEKWDRYLYKDASPEMLKRVNIQIYNIWDEVYVQRTNWWESRAQVYNYDPLNNVYRVKRSEWWKEATKSVTMERLRPAA